MVRPPDETAVEPYAVIEALRQQLAESLAERDATLARETALTEVLDLINRSQADAQPVFDKILEKAHSLCDATMGALLLYSNELIWAVATRGYSDAADALARQPRTLAPEQQGLAQGQRVLHITGVEAFAQDANSDFGRAFVELTGARTYLMVPFRKDGKLLGAISVVRQEVRSFSEPDIALLENFAAQAVIAMENARLLTETREALEQQTATAEVLQVINRSPGNLAPVFDALLEKALRLCDAAFGSLATYDGAYFHAVAMRGVAPGYAASLNRPLPPFPAGTGRLVAGESVVHVDDITATDDYRHGIEHIRASADQGGMRTALFVALRKDDTLLGRITIFRQEVRPFSDKQIELLRNLPLRR
jgi:GAF domain-containing protein